jgi:uncharacterized protein YbaA (DUF1428 family)
MYVDCFVVPVKKNNLKKYVAFERKMAKIFLKYGALSVTEAVADDVKPGKRTSFPQAVKLAEDETVVVAWIAFKNRKARDACMKKCMEDPTMSSIPASEWPFDGKRMFFGGFKSILSLGE